MQSQHSALQTRLKSSLRVRKWTIAANFSQQAHVPGTNIFDFLSSGWSQIAALFANESLFEDVQTSMPNYHQVRCCAACWKPSGKTHSCLNVSNVVEPLVMVNLKQSKRGIYKHAAENLAQKGLVFLQSSHCPKTDPGIGLLVFRKKEHQSLTSVSDCFWWRQKGTLVFCCHATHPSIRCHFNPRLSGIISRSLQIKQHAQRVATMTILALFISEKKLWRKDSMWEGAITDTAIYGSYRSSFWPCVYNNKCASKQHAAILVWANVMPKLLQFNLYFGSGVQIIHLWLMGVSKKSSSRTRENDQFDVTKAEEKRSTDQDQDHLATKCVTLSWPVSVNRMLSGFSWLIYVDYVLRWLLVALPCTTKSLRGQRTKPKHCDLLCNRKRGSTCFLKYIDVVLFSSCVCFPFTTCNPCKCFVT